MADHAPEELLGYLLGALDDSEHESLERRVQEDPRLVEELCRLREKLQPLWVAQPDYAPPPGLADRTCRCVASRCVKPKSRALPAPAPSNAGFVDEEPAVAPSGHSSGWLELTAAAGIVMAASLLLFPAIQNSRSQARQATCAYQLGQLGVALNQYSGSHHDFYPPVVDEDGFSAAARYAATLISHGYVDDPAWFVCPGSPLAEQRDFRVPTLDELDLATPDELARIVPAMGGSYAYHIGFIEDGRYYGPRRLPDAYLILLGDMPDLDRPGGQSPNHDGRGQNLLRDGGEVVFWRTPQPPPGHDHVFVNDFGVVDAGQHRHDMVLGVGGSVPRLPGRASRH
jgi:hypothetical protein